MSSSYNVFVSYAAADREWVQGYLLEALAAAGVRYQHEPDFRVGAPRLAEFERAVRDSERTLLVLSPAYLAEDFSLFTEILAQTYGSETSRWPVMLLLLHPVTLPPRLSFLMGLDATDPARWEPVVERLCWELGRPVPGPSAPPPCPYVGMAPFSEQDRGRFFGRSDEIVELRQRMQLHPLVALVGPSGSGKSSLVHAGLIPSLREGGSWIIRTMRPGEAPVLTLATALGGSLNQPIGAATRLLAAQGTDARLLLVVDQLEELFSVATQGVMQFQEMLLSLAQVPGCHVVLTVRAEFYPELMAAPLWPTVRAQRMELLPLEGDALRQAIQWPAENVGVFVEAALVERLLADAAGEPGALPLLQETMVLLWERLERRLLPLQAYETLEASGRRGLAAALTARADAALATLSPVQREIARRILLRLVQVVEGRGGIRRQQPASALRSGADDPGLFEHTLRHLATYRLVTLSSEEEADAVRVDLAHEALITRWPTFQRWMEDALAAERSRRAEEEPTERQATRRLKVFLCHSSSDKPTVRELYQRLREDHLQPWLDEEDILPGQEWDQEIRAAIRECDIVLVCLSGGSINRVGYLQKEIKTVLDVADEQPPGAIFLIPVRLEICDVPERFRRWQWVDLFEESGYERLMRSLSKRAGMA